MQAVTITQITPPELESLIENSLRKILSTSPNEPVSSFNEELLTVPQAAEFLSLSVPTIYGLLHKGSIPSMKQGKRVYFSKQELLAWLKDGRKNTLIELGKEADVFLETLKIKRG